MDKLLVLPYFSLMSKFHIPCYLYSLAYLLHIFALFLASGFLGYTIYILIYSLPANNINCFKCKKFINSTLLFFFSYGLQLTIYFIYIYTPHNELLMFFFKAGVSIFFFFLAPEGPDSKYLRLCQGNVSIKTIEAFYFGIKNSLRQHINKWMWLSANKTLFPKRGGSKIANGPWSADPCFKQLSLIDIQTKSIFTTFFFFFLLHFFE